MSAKRRLFRSSSKGCGGWNTAKKEAPAVKKEETSPKEVEEAPKEEAKPEAPAEKEEEVKPAAPKEAKKKARKPAAIPRPTSTASVNRATRPTRSMRIS